MRGRLFDGTDDYIGFPATGWNLLSSSMAMCVIFKRAVTGVKHVLIAGVGSGTSDNSLHINSSDQLVWYQNGTSRTSTTTIGTGRYLAVCSKSAGTTTPTLYLLNYETGVWVQENFSGTMANKGASSTEFRIGDDGLGGGFFNGEILAVSFWSVSMNLDLAKSWAHNLNAHLQHQFPRGFYVFNGNPANEVTNLLRHAATNSTSVEQSAITGTAEGTTEFPCYFIKRFPLDRLLIDMVPDPFTGSWGMLALFEPPSGPFKTPVFSDDYERAGGSGLGGDYGGGDSVLWDIEDGQAKVSSHGFGPAIIQEPALTTDQYIDIDCIRRSDAMPTIMFLRVTSSVANSSNITGYAFYVNHDGSAIGVQEVTAGVGGTELGETTWTPPAVGESFRFGASALGSELAFYIDGVEINSVTDTTHDTGLYGAMGGYNAGGETFHDNLEFGDITA